MSGPQKPTPDAISVIAAIGAPTFVIFRLAIGDWGTVLLFLLILAVAVATIWRDDQPTCSDLESDDSSPAIAEHQAQPVKTPPMVMAAVAGGYILILILCAVAGYLTT